MFDRVLHAAALGALLVMIVSGCVDPASTKKPGADGKQKADKTEVPAGQPAAGTESIDTAGLPKAGDASPPLDGGHLEVSVPASWVVPPRDDRWLYRITATEDDAYPTIFISQSDAKAPDGDGLTAENVEAHARAVAASFEERGTKLREPVQAIKIGDVYAVQWVQGGQVTDIGNVVTYFDRLLIERIAAGRAYTIELRAVRGTLDQFRPSVYATVMRMRVQ